MVGVSETPHRLAHGGSGGHGLLLGVAPHRRQGRWVAGDVGPGVGVDAGVGSGVDVLVGGGLVDDVDVAVGHHLRHSARPGLDHRVAGHHVAARG
jgi:hypothetical protein